MASSRVKQELLAFARELGFDVCRVARCVAPPHVAEFRKWIAEGKAGEMAWMERNADRRTDPQLVLPGAKSVIVLAMNYWAPAPAAVGAMARKVQPVLGPEGAGSAVPGSEIGRGSRIGAGASAPTGKIARYAWGNDYHDVIEPKLREIDRFLAARGGSQRCYVDTGPVLERDFAALAGVGWHGKSTMLISPELGTWFFLSEVLTTLELEPDEPLPDRCGRCTRCVDRCPTGAITSPHHVDARRCVSYLTIELKGSIPEELRPLVGDRIYGCDDCLAACPWNRFAKESNESAFAAREFTAGWSLRDFLNLDDEQFRTLFRKSPIKRVKRRGFLRNVCVALGNVGGPEDLPALEAAAQDPEPLVAEHAAWAIRRIRERARPLPSG